MALQEVSIGSIGPLLYDDVDFYAISTPGQLHVETPPSEAQHVLRLEDVDNIILSDDTPLSVETAGDAGVALVASRSDHVHPGVNIDDAQTIIGAKTFEDTTPTTGSTILKVKSGAGQGFNPLFEIRDAGNVYLGLFNWDGGYYSYVGGIAKAAVSPGVGLQIASDRKITWQDNTNMFSGAIDTALSRNAAGVVEVNNGTLGSIRDLRIRTLNPTTGNVGIGVVPGTGLSRLFMGGTAIVAGDWALSAGWGAGATVSAVTGNDNRGTVSVLTNAADTPTANPTLTLTFKDGTWTTSPIAVACMRNGSTGPTANVTCSPGVTTLVLRYNGTPTALSALAYLFNYIVVG